MHDPYSALKLADFRRYLGGNFAALLGSQMQSVAVGWEIYERTGQAIQLGLVGLTQVIPVVLLALPAGHVIDRTDRRRVIMGAVSVLLMCSLGLALISARRWPIQWVYVCLLINGVARAFLQPAKAALLPLIVPRTQFANAVTWSTSGFQLATVVGPGLGGLVIAARGTAFWVYVLDAALTVTFLIALWRLRPPPAARSAEPLRWESLVAGAAFVWRTKLILGAITLDMFAVLFGGATALLPIFSKDILHAGPDGLGWLRAAPGLGALCMSFILAHRPPLQRAGPVLLWSVVGFGLMTIVFGFSRAFWLSWGSLFAIGALDMVSVIIRHTLVQVWTPDVMRGRVSAVNGMFISVSNELGGFESGLVAQLFHIPAQPEFGPTVSVVSGGIGTLLVVLLIALRFPQVRSHGRLDQGPPAEVEK